MASTTTPVESKVAASSAVSVITGVVTWILVTYVPSFHSGLPGPLATFLPWIVGAVTSAAAGYLAPHTTRPDEVMAQATALLEHAGVALPKT